MNARPAILASFLIGTLLANAQNVIEEPQPDSVLDAIHEFAKNNKNTKDKPNEVTVVLDPVGVPPAAVKTESKPDPAPAEAPKAVVASPVLVTGKPPEIADPPPATANDAPAEEPLAKPESGLAVRVEKLQTGKGSVNPSQVKLLAPFPAKPLAQPPAGWKLDPSETAPPFTREVEIAPGSKITLTIHPHVLVPDADGASSFIIPEPGYDSALGYQQTATVGAILSNSLRQLDNDSKQLGDAIDSLQQLLISLPKPEQPEPEVKPATTTRKR